MATGFTVPSISDIWKGTQDLSMKAYGLNPNIAGISQDPSELEFGEIKQAGLSPSNYAETSQYGLMEDLAESTAGQFSPTLTKAASTFGPVLTAVTSPIYDLGQAAQRAYSDPNLGILQAIKQENIPQMWKGRTLGATKFLADQLGIGSLFGQPKFRKEMVKKVTPKSQAVQVAKKAESTSNKGGGGGSSQQERKKRRQGTQKQERKRKQRTRSRAAQRGRPSKRQQRSRSRAAQRRTRSSRRRRYANGGIVTLNNLTRSL
jgi:hypothetical protein